jgi:hypothetical protein
VEDNRHKEIFRIVRRMACLVVGGSDFGFISGSRRDDAVGRMLTVFQKDARLMLQIDGRRDLDRRLKQILIGN